MQKALLDKVAPQQTDDSSKQDTTSAAAAAASDTVRNSASERRDRGDDYDPLRADPLRVGPPSFPGPPGLRPDG